MRQKLLFSLSAIGTISLVDIVFGGEMIKKPTESKTGDKNKGGVPAGTPSLEEHVEVYPGKV